MFRSRFFWKLLGGFGAVLVLLVVLVEIFIPGRIEKDTLAEIENALNVQTTLIGDLLLPFLRSPSDSGLQERMADLAADAGVRLTVIGADGLVLADSHESPDRMDNHGQRSEIRSARREGTGAAIRYTHTLKTRMMFFARSIDVNGEIVGYIRAAMPMTVVDRRLRHLHSMITIGALLSAAAALLVGMLIAGHIVRPVRELTELTRSMAAEEAGLVIPVRGGDEVRELAGSFEAMAVGLRERLAALTEERNRLQAILTGMVEGVVAVDRRERVLHMNDVAAQLLNADREGSLGRPLWEVTRTPQIGEILKECMRRRTALSQEIRQTTPDGERVLEVRGSALPGEGERAGAVLLLHEVTELRRLEEVRRDFVANVSHELKTPLSAIRGLAETIQDDPSMEPDRRRSFSTRIVKQTERLTALITDLLSISRLESREKQIEQERIDLREVGKAALSGMTTHADDAGLALRAEIAEVPLLVAGDRLALEQVIGNLLDNAIKYTPAGGRVWLRMRREGDRAIAEVEDTGVGIEPRDKDRIFERFYRVDKARSRELGGTGLGLSIVKHVLLSHGGGVEVESEPGRGSLFRIFLPLAE